jgi:integrase
MVARVSVSAAILLPNDHDGSTRVGWAQARLSKDGTPRFRACYRDARGKVCSAGTFATERAADKAWQAAETHIAEGRVRDPRRGRQKFRTYVLETWLINHVVEPSTRQNYVYYLHRYLLPEFGQMSMRDIQPSDVRAWITRLSGESASPETIRTAKMVLSAIFTTAFDDGIAAIHPCRGIRTPTAPKKRWRIITGEQFDVIYAALDSTEFKLTVETAIESGLRWGELTELRVQDVDLDTHILTVSRAVIQLVMKRNPDRKRFHVKLPKDNEHRRLKLSKQIIDKLRAHVDSLGLGPDDLLFAIRQQQSKPVLRPLPDIESLGMTEPNGRGRRYQHGTLSGYSMGPCRCRHCKGAYAAYRARRRADGKDEPRRPRSLTTDGHIPRDWFRTNAWKPALDAAGLGFRVRFYDLRHAHASWLLAGGADLQVVKERLGHGSITTTEKYLHTLPDADETALDALDRIRNPKQRRSQA